MRFYGWLNGPVPREPEDPERCVASVWDSKVGARRQCNMARGHGPDRELCEMHSSLLETNTLAVCIPEDKSRRK